MKLSAKQALDQHIRTHTKEQPYVCKFGCGRTFKQHSALSKSPLTCLMRWVINLEQRCTTELTPRKSLFNAMCAVLSLPSLRT